MRKVDTRNSDVSIYIVCEGTKSEPWFLRRFIEWVRPRFKVNYKCDIFPVPEEEQKPADGSKQKKSSRKKSGRKTIGTDNVGKHTETPKGGNPLYWVQHGIEKLSAYSEVYVVFDKDGHPKLKDAFDKVKKATEDKKHISIIFNSRSFEYYMLLHFEYIYHAFNKTECGEKVNDHTRYFKCGLPNAIIGKACNGDICINGYARVRGYWSDSKDEHTFDCATNIWRGIAYGESIRRLALNDNPETETYKLNPYVDLQRLLIRLMDMSLLENGNPIINDVGNGAIQSISRDGDFLKLHNASPLKMNLKKNWLIRYSFPETSRKKDEFKNDEDFARSQNEKHLDSAMEPLTLNSNESEVINVFTQPCKNQFSILEFCDKRYLIL